MKCKIVTILASFLILFSACENELEKDLTFDVRVAPASNVQIGDSIITAPKGTTLKFEFSGDPDFISFSYNLFNTTKSTLSFSTQPAWGTHIQNTLSVYLFETSDTLLLNDAKKDSATIVNRAWTDITSQCNLSSIANTTKKADVSLNDYRGKKICLAFRYKTDYVADWQPTWTISGLVMNDTVISTGAKASSTLAATMGFTPFDLLNGTTPYQSADLAGVWNIANTAAIVMKRTASGGLLNTDWLVSRPISVPQGVNTLSAKMPVKNTTNRVGTYSYQFTASGEYTLTFFASNANYVRRLTTERKIKVVITD